MEIIGKTDKGFILVATEDELANLCGYYGRHYGDDSHKRLGIGSRVDISSMFKQLYYMAQNQDYIKRAQDTLIDAAKRLEPVIPIIDAVVKRKAE